MENKNIQVIQIENNKFYENFGNHTRIELKNALSIGKIVFALQKFDENNKQIAYISCFVDEGIALALSEQIISGRFLSYSKTQPQDKIIDFYKIPGGSKNKETNEITYRDLTLQKGKLWMFKAQECPGTLSNKGGYVPNGKATAMVTFGCDFNTLLAIACKVKQECLAYRTAQLIKNA